MPEIWILGAAGRVGRAVAKDIAAQQGLTPVLIGRNAQSLQDLAQSLGPHAKVRVSTNTDAMAADIAQAKPAVVVNTIGPFAQTAPKVVRACLPHSHYVDLSNEIDAALDVLSLDDQARAAGKSLVTGAGFGVLGTESVALKLCSGQPPAKRIRTDAIPLLTEGGVVGEALASTLVEAFASGGRRYAEGRLQRTLLGSDVVHFKTPTGDPIASVASPLGELAAAQRASHAAFATAGSSEVPSAWPARIMLPAITKLMSIQAIGNLAKRQLARLRIDPPKQQRDATWARAHVEWADGAVREGWLRVGDASAFTTRVTSLVTVRIAQGEARPGAYTPGALFGPQLAEDAGGQFVIS